MSYLSNLMTAWMLFLCVQAFSTDYTGGARLPSRFIEVRNLDIVPPAPRSDAWTVSLSTEQEQIKFVVKEHWSFTDEGLLSRATRGHTYVSDAESWQSRGWSRMVINSDVMQHSARGSFELLDEIWHLSEHPEKGYIIWKESDLVGGSEDIEVKSRQRVLQPRADESIDLHPLSRSLLSSIGNTTGCPQSPYVARIGVAADMNFMKTFNSTSDARTHIIDTINKASQVWEQAFNISLQLGSLIIANESYQAKWNTLCTGSENSVDALQSRLNAVSAWRTRSPASADDGLAQWTLFTDCPSGNVVGLAWQSTACNASAANVVHHSLLDYRVLAHETGHVFGAVHDCTNASCAQNGQETLSDTSGSASSCCPLSADSCDARGQFIMNPASDLQQFKFSPCSQGNVCSQLGSRTIDATCLLPQGNTTSGNNTSSPPSSTPTNTPPTAPTDTCSPDLTWDRFRKCRRNAQCVEVTGQLDSYACGNPESCTMRCFDSSTNQCLEQTRTFEDRTPCGFDSISAKVCSSGRCVYRRPAQERPSRRLATWIWVLVLVLSILAALALLGGMMLVKYQRYRKREQASQNMHGNQAPPEKLGFPEIYERGLAGSHYMGTAGRPPKAPTHSASSSYDTAGDASFSKNTALKEELSSKVPAADEREVPSLPQSVFSSRLSK